MQGSARQRHESVRPEMHLIPVLVGKIPTLYDQFLHRTICRTSKKSYKTRKTEAAAWRQSAVWRVDGRQQKDVGSHAAKESLESQEGTKRRRLWLQLQQKTGEGARAENTAQNCTHTLASKVLACNADGHVSVSLGVEEAASRQNEGASIPTGLVAHAEFTIPEEARAW
jgi:hypothetical protein